MIETNGRPNNFLKLKNVRKNFYRLLICVLLTSTSAVTALAQNFSNYNWYFGNSPQGIRFSRSDDSPSLVNNQFVPFGNGGSAVASNPINGDLIFYTDGQRVIDATHQQTPNGTLAGDNTRNQPVAICPNPAVSGEYFIFHADAAGTVRFSVYDSLLNGNAVSFGQPPLGDIDPARRNQSILGLPTGQSEAMIMLDDPDSDDFWLMTQQTGTTNYHFVRISEATGITYQGLVSGGFLQNAANFAYHAPTRRIAVSPKEINRAVELITITFPVAPATLPSLTSTTVDNSDTDNGVTQAIYDAEFSTNGQYLYVSQYGEGAATGNVLQFDLNEPSLTAQTVLTNLPTESYGLQMGPDSTIYHLYQSGGNFFLGSLDNTDTVAAAVIYRPQAFPGNFGGRQFPSFAPTDSLDIKVFFEVQGTCANSPSSFFPTVTPGADSLVWDFGDGNVSSEWSPVHTYEADGTFNVQVTAFLNGQAKDTVQAVTIAPFDTQITLVQDTTACSCELPFPKAQNPPPPCTQFSISAQVQGGNATWQWFGPAGAIGTPSTGGTATLQPDSAGYYYIVATENGCSTVAGVNIKEYGVEDQRANIWYFGQNAGIDFNPLFDVPSTGAVPISNPVMNAPEGTSTISDRNGQVIFFTDGNTVWDRNFTPVATGIGGETGSSQSALIVPVPGDETLYYIFTTQEIYGSYAFRLSYSLFNIRLNGGTGGLMEQNVTLFTKSTERITGNGNWLIAHEYGNNSFRAYRITQNGIGNPVISSIGSDHTLASAPNGQGYMKLGPQNRLAVALSTPGVSNVVELFDFADSSGTVSNFRRLNLNSTTGQVYGIEFGAGGNKVFATLLDATSKVYEFAIDSLGNPYQVRDPAPMSAQTYNERLGAIQIGPDGQLYVAVDNKPYLGVITVNGDTTVASTFQVNQFQLQPATPPAATLSRLGLPNFIQIIADPIQGPGISVTGLCLGDSTSFSGTGTDPIDEFFWQVSRNGSVITSSNEQSFNFLFAAAGLYDVRLEITNRCGLYEVLTRQIRINAPPPDPSAVLSLCTPPQILDANPTNVPSLSYVWVTGDTTKTISVSRAGFYDVTLTDRTTGCATDGLIELYPALTTIDLGPDSTSCSQPNASVTLNTNINIPNHQWFRNGAPIAGNTGPTQVADLSLAAVDTYVVRFTDPGNGCVVIDTVVFTVKQSPVVALTSGGAINCTPPFNGQLAVNISQPAGGRVSYILAGPNFVQTPSNVVVPSGPMLTPATLEPGTYTIQVTDQVTGCFTTDNEIINTNAFTVTGTALATCSTGPIDVVTNSATAGTYRVIDAATGTVVVPPTAQKPATTNFQTVAVPPGTYLVEVTIAGCIAGDNDVLVPAGPDIASAAINTANLCTTQQATAQGTGATTFDWSASPAGAISSALNAATVTVNPGTWTLSVTMDDGAGPGCPTTVTQVVSVDPFTPDFNFDSCTDPTILIAAPTGNVNPVSSYFYTWTGPQNGTGQQFSVTASGNYTLSMQSPLSGCPAQTVSKFVQVLGELSVTITTVNTPCEESAFGLLATPSRAVNSYQWALDGVDITGATAAQLDGQTEEGLYSVRVSDGNCTADADLDILLSPITPGAMTDSRLICPDDANPDPSTRVAVLDPGPGFASYDWFEVINGSPSPLNVNTQTYTTDVAGIFQVNLVNAFGCSSQDRTTVEVECDPVIVGPNAFRPSSTYMENGEMVNQNFRLFTFFIDDEDFQVYIFNRWGEMIFASTERQFQWNGGYKNNVSQLVPAGTYTYLVRYKSSYRPEEGVKEMRGGVVLMR